MSENQGFPVETTSINLAVSDGTTMPAYVARPTGAGSKAGVMVFQEAFGVNAHIRDVTERFAREGYLAVAPALFHRTDPHFEGSYTDFNPVMAHMQALNDEGMTADMKAAYGWLTGEQKVTAVGTVGYCMGGRASFLADAALPVQAAISYYGGGIAPSERRPSSDLLGRASDLHAPILLFWGGKDGHIGPDQCRAVEDALIAAGKEYTQVTFSRADHGFFCDVRASYDAEAARYAWGLTLQFFASHLRSGSV
ncbi:MAG TPA: dienelactone hydrolase family protein [Armatimonadota bacterium]|nr:dienelactone hydrolase family protein [Armatimonadota bacterium]